jgi:uncharacterized protein YdhG (YjbR/CyaY superfamily)
VAGTGVACIVASMLEASRFDYTIPATSPVETPSNVSKDDPQSLNLQSFVGHDLAATIGSLKMKQGTPSPNSIDAYIADFPKDVQAILEKIRGIVRDAAPEAQEAIKYQIPTFVLNGNLVHFAAFQKHIGFYPTPSGIEHFKDALSAFNSAKGSVQFPLDSPIPYSLIKKMVKFRVNENREKSRAKTRSKKSS